MSVALQLRIPKRSLNIIDEAVAEFNAWRKKHKLTRHTNKLTRSFVLRAGALQYSRNLRKQMKKAEQGELHGKKRR